MNNLLREAEDKLEDAVNPFAELKSVWVRYMYSNCIYVPVFTICNHHDHVIGCVLGVSEFSWVLLSAVFVDLYGVVDRKRIQRFCEPRSIEMEPIMKNTSNIQNGVSAPS